MPGEPIEDGLNSTIITVHRSSAIKKIMMAWCQHHQVNFEEAMFCFAGREISSGAHCADFLNRKQYSAETDRKSIAGLVELASLTISRNWNSIAASVVPM